LIPCESMFPIGDINPHFRRPLLTYAIVIANLFVWVWIQGLGQPHALIASICNWGFVPGALSGAVQYGGEMCMGLPPKPLFGVFSSMFMHGGWFHLLGNMWFLHVFGNNIEDRMGHGMYLVFYLLSGLGAAGLQFIFDPNSTVPMVGASGAISGIMGAYLVIFPRIPIKTLLFFGFFYRVVLLPAFVMLGYWFVIQLFGGAMSTGAMGGVAHWAHVGGFVVGLILGFFFRR
jgi:membrane associated rhomboid family serine protease